MSDIERPARIFLEPGKGDPEYGPMWCEDDVWTGVAAYADDGPPTEYVRADIARTVTPAMVAAACDVEPINFRDMTDEMRGDGLNLTAKLHAENMRRCLAAALEARDND